MDSYLIFVFCCLFASALTLPSPRPKYKLDYKYNLKTDAFYKLHRDPKFILEAEDACKAEGAQLIVPSEEDLRQIFTLIVQHGIGSSVWIGRDEKNTNCHVVTSDLYINVAECTGRLPFVCKVTAAEANSYEACGAHGYRYYPETGSCYRVPPYATKWSKALADCQKENAHLVVLNSGEEAKTIKAFLETVPPVPYASNDMYFYAGFSAEKNSREFRTIFGKTLEENGYVGWSEYEPNNWSGIEYCGSVARATGMNNDIVCNWDFGFICEKEVSSPQMTDTPNMTELSTIIPSETTDSSEEMTTQASETNEISANTVRYYEVTARASETNEPNYEMLSGVLQLDESSPKRKTQVSDEYVSESDESIPKITTQASETNDPKHETATKASNLNEPSAKTVRYYVMTTQASETTEANHEIVMGAIESNKSSDEIGALESSESSDKMTT